MKTIAIISSSVREGRLSHRASLFIKKYLEDNAIVKVVMLDLKEYDFPLFNERLQYQDSPSPATLDYVKKFNEADGIIIVSPVYNSSYPASLKNVIDLLWGEWSRKPVAVASVTFSPTPGISTIQEIQTIMLKMGALVTPTLYTVVNVASDYDDEGNPVNKEKAEKYIKPMVDGLTWLMRKSE